MPGRAVVGALTQPVRVTVVDHGMKMIRFIPPTLAALAATFVMTAPPAMAAPSTPAPVTKPCPGDQQYYPDTDPTKFWECSNGTAYRFDCPANLWWDIELLTCNYPDVATRP